MNSAHQDVLQQARAHVHGGRWANAVPLYQQALQVQPHDVAACLELSGCLQRLGLVDEALVVARSALPHAATAPPGAGLDDPAAATQLQIAHLYLAQQRFDAAGAAYSGLLAHPRLAAPAAAGVARVWLHEGYPGRALEALAPHAGAGAPPEVVDLQAHALFEAGDAQAACAALVAYLQRAPAQSAPAQPVTVQPMLSNALMFASYTPGYDAWVNELRPRAERLYAPRTDVPARSSASASASASAAASAAVPAAGALRVGFVSADLGAHPVGYFIASFVPHLAAHGVQVLLYDNGTRHDAITARLQQAAARWVPIAALDTAAAQQCIRADAPDVLVDLSGHTQGHWLDVFAERACAVQASFLGYFGSTFVPAIDALIADPWLVPAHEEAGFSERVVRLEHSRFCYQAPDDAPAPAPPPSLANGHVTFGACANVAKLGDACVALWSRVLHAVPGSRLVLRWKTLVDATVCAALLGRFAAHGVPAGRIELHGALRHRDMMAAYAGIDVALDTHPFSGATTTCEALWMGLPVITLAGDQPAGRQSEGILRTLGRAGWVASDADDFVRIARDCAADADGRSAWRNASRERMAATTLGDGAAYAAGLAGVLRRLAR